MHISSGSRAGASLRPSWEQSRGQWGAKWKPGSVQLSNWYGFKFWSLTLSGYLRHMQAQPNLDKAFLVTINSILHAQYI